MTRFIALTFLLFSFNATFSQKNKAKNIETSKPFVLGVIEEIQSKELNEKRILNIYLPEGYNPAEATKYPVIYLLDGSADEDFIHISGLVQFNSFEWINQVPKSIVVGIATVDRKRDFTFPTTLEKDKTRFPTTGHSDQFIAFIEKELQPFIEKNTIQMILKPLLASLLAVYWELKSCLKSPLSLINMLS